MTTKKEFRERCSFHHYGKGYRLNVIYYDWENTPDGNGYKYVVKCTNGYIKVPELFNVLYNWVVNNIEPPIYVRRYVAPTDKERFKVKLCEKF